MKRQAGLAASITALVLAACAVRQPAPAPAARPPPPPAPPPLSSVDANFINQATIAGLAELQGAQLALQRAAHPLVRQFAQQLVSDYTAANRQITVLVQSKGASLPAELDPERAAEAERLEEARGARFDHAYLEDQIASHEAVLALFQDESEQGGDPEVKAFARDMLPILQQHLAMAESIVGSSGARHLRRRWKPVSS